MLKGISYKKKNILLAIGALIVAIISYNAAFKQTIELAEKCSENEKQLKAAANAQVRIAQLKAELSAVDMVLGSGGGQADFQQSLLEKVSSYCSEHDLVLREFPQPFAQPQQEYVVETNRLVVEGPFSQLLQLLFELEQKDRIGKVAGVEFLSEKNLKTRRFELTAAIYVQNIKKMTNAS